jgi:hypothetical protein
MGVPFWTCPLTFYGSEKIVRAQWEAAKERFTRVAGVKFTEDVFLRFPSSDEQLDAVAIKPRVGLPSLRSPVLPFAYLHVDLLVPDRSGSRRECSGSQRMLKDD